MRDLTEAQAMCDAVARSMKTRKPKTDETDGGANEAGLTFSGVVNFSDTRNDKADFFAPEKAETAFNDIRRLTVVHSVKDSIKQYILQRRSTIAANKRKKEEAEKLRRNGWQSN
jgi:hypothetical protein